METMILASGSPRRRELLTRCRIPFRIIPPNVNESIHSGEVAREAVVRIAELKVNEIIKIFKNESPRWVLGVDTIVNLDNEIIGKPKSVEHAESILRLLSGRVHKVVSGMSLLKEKGEKHNTKIVETEVKFKEMTSDEIRYYIGTGEWSGVAGGYRIQGSGSFFIEWIKGSFSNVMGLPLETFYGMLRNSKYLFD